MCFLAIDFIGRNIYVNSPHIYNKNCVMCLPLNFDFITMILSRIQSMQTKFYYLMGKDFFDV